MAEVFSEGVWIIIISYNKINPAITAINSVFKSCPNANIVLIDNSENSVIETISKKLNIHDKITFVANNKNLGFSKAVNQGIKIALRKGARYILLLNDDAYIDKNCIPLLLEALEKDKRAMLAGPTIFYAKEPNKVWHTGGYLNKLLGKIEIQYKNKYLSSDFLENLSIRDVDFLTGCVLMIKREAFEKIGFFDESLFFYGEDFDFSLRTIKKGYKLLWVPNAFAWHDINVYQGRTNPFVLYNLAKNNIIVRKKNFSKLYFLYYLLGPHFFLFTPYRIYQILNGSKDLKSVVAWFKGTIDGIKFKK